MPRRLLAINVVLACVAVLCVGLIVKQVATTRPAAPARGRGPVAAAADPASGSDAKLSPQAYNVIANRNLFSPTRSETAGPGIAGVTQAPIVKPNLHGVVLREGSPIAYMEDPLTKRIAGYRIGDPIAGGTVQTISADAVVISRPDGMVDVRLRDPSKPRPAPPQPGQPMVPGQPPLPGQPPFPGQPPSGGQLPNQGLVPVPGPTQPFVPSPRAFNPPGSPLPPGQTMPPPPAIQQPTQTQPGAIPFGRPAPSLGRRLPPIPQDPSGRPLPAPSQ
jgi:hypothetical protein